MGAKKGIKGKKGGGEETEEKEGEDNSQLALKTRLDESLVLIDYLKDSQRNLELQIEDLELNRKNLIKSHEEEVQLVYEEARTRQTSSDLKTEELQNIIKNLESDVQGGDVLQEEARSLREQVKYLLTSMESEGREHADETHELSQKGFKLRMQLEQTFRRTLKEMEQQYREEALQTMMEESKQALNANEMLKHELEMQSNGIHTMMKKFDKHKEELKSLRIEKQLLDDAHARQQEEMYTLRRTIQLQDNKINQTQSLVIENQNNKVLIEELKLKLELSKKENLNLVSELDKAKGSYSKWKKRAFDLSRQIDNNRKEFERSKSSNDNKTSMETENTLSSSPSNEDGSIDYTSYWKSTFPINNGAARSASHMVVSNKGKGGSRIANRQNMTASAPPFGDQGELLLDTDILTSKTSKTSSSKGHSSSSNSLNSKKQALSTMQRYFVPS